MFAENGFNYLKSLACFGCTPADFTLHTSIALKSDKEVFEFLWSPWSYLESYFLESDSQKSLVLDKVRV